MKIYIGHILSTLQYLFYGKLKNILYFTLKKKINKKKHIGPYDYYDIIHLFLIFIVYENFHYVLRKNLY